MRAKQEQIEKLETEIAQYKSMIGKAKRADSPDVPRLIATQHHMMERLKRVRADVDARLEHTTSEIERLDAENAVAHDALTAKRTEIAEAAERMQAAIKEYEAVAPELAPLEQDQRLLIAERDTFARVLQDWDALQAERRAAMGME